MKPIHDWTRVAAGDFHHFHQSWVAEIAKELNREGLPEGLHAMVEQILGPIPDVVALPPRPGARGSPWWRGRHHSHPGRGIRTSTGPDA